MRIYTTHLIAKFDTHLLGDTSSYTHGCHSARLGTGYLLVTLTVALRGTTITTCSTMIMNAVHIMFTLRQTMCLYGIVATKRDLMHDFNFYDILEVQNVLYTEVLTENWISVMEL